MKIVVTGMIATYPLGGVAWDYGQYVLGLERLGAEVTYLEDTGLPGYDPEVGEYSDESTYGSRFLAATLAQVAPRLGSRWHYRAADGRTFGLPPDDLRDAIAEADLFLNVSGSALLREQYRHARRIALIDTDPGWNHFVEYAKWDAGRRWADDATILGYRGHDVYFTYAENIGRPGCGLPSLGLAWHPTRPPVVLDQWVPEPPGTTWTTVMTWDNFRRPIEHAGQTYGTKELEFPAVEGLPGSTPAVLEIAVGGDTAPRARWRELGWSVVEAQDVSRTAGSYRSYVQRSRGEFSVAKNVYVATQSGWFSCRSVCYLAAGRPVVLQDTGFSAGIESGCGLLAWSTPREAREALVRVEADYQTHARAARQVAEHEFASDGVLGDLLERAGLGT